MINTRPVLIQKFKLIFLPSLYTIIGFLIIYTFLHWLLIIKLGLFAIKENYADVWTPYILPWIAAFTWLRPRIKLLSLKSKRGDSTMGLQLVISLAIAAPLMVAQSYLETASGSLTPLNHVDEIVKKPASKFYTISSYFIDTANKGVAFISDVSGKNNESLNMHIYISCPLYDADLLPTRIGAITTGQQITSPKAHQGILFLLDNHEIDSVTLAHFPRDSVAAVKVLRGLAARSIFGDAGANGVVMVRTKNAVSHFSAPFIRSSLPAPSAWCCFEYHKGIKNHQTAEKKTAAYHLFFDLSRHEFQNTNMRGLSYFERTGYNDNLTGFKKAIKKTDLVKDSAVRNILEAKFTPYADRNGHKLAWIFGSLAIGSVVWFALLLVFRFDEEKLNAFLSGEKQKNSNDYKEMLLLFKPRAEFYVTPVIVDLNILIFLFMVFARLGFVSFNSLDLLHWGANYRPKVADGEWWRLLTSVFLHNGIYHLLTNMAALLFVGMLLEPKLGSKKMIICYLVTGLCASLASIWWNDAVVSVGASGAIFGLYGIFLSFILTRVYPKEVSKVFLITMIIFIGFNLIAGLNGGIDNAGHIGGLLSGIVVGLLLSPQLRLTQRENENNGGDMIKELEK